MQSARYCCVAVSLATLGMFIAALAAVNSVGGLEAGCKTGVFRGH